MAIIFVRTVIVFLSLLTSMRIMGKRQLGELELSELVVAVLLSDLASHPLQDIGIPMVYGIIPVITLLCLELIISGLSMRSIRLRAILCGKPSILVENGRVIQQAMHKNRFTLEELTEELRNQSITDISKVKYAILETDGRLNTILFPAEQPVTARQMNISVKDPGFPVIIVNDGKIMKENLDIAEKTEDWLNTELKKHGVSGPEQVYILSVDKSGQIYYAPMEGQK